MDLKISYNWLKEYVKTNQTARDFARTLSLSGPSVDRVHEIKSNFSKVVVGEILTINNHPNADKLRLCRVDVGSAKLEIVCGAPNIKEGQKVPVVLIGGEVSGMIIKETEIRGVKSYGMMCSQKELGIGDDHSGIYILPSYTKVGLPLEKVLTVTDDILDIEVTSNRPDAMSVIGIAREASAIGGYKFVLPESKIKTEPKDGSRINLTVNNKESKLCQRYQAVVITGVKVESSPLWMQQRLMASGLRPINNLVDITNYILLELGRPMHVFDYEKLAGQEIMVRQAREGEKILALDGKIYNLNADNLVIADREKPVAVAGVMGGELSAATESTTTIVLESANFNAVSVRKTARVLNLHSESSNLYEKSLSAEGTDQAIKRAIELVAELAGGEVASKIFDEGGYRRPKKEIKITAEEVAKTLGVKINRKKITDILTKLGFDVSKDKNMIVTVPWWRDGDIEEPHDLVEEVARIYGYHNLPAILPAGELPANITSQKDFFWADRTKDIMVGLGYSENCNYSFISEKLIGDCALKTNDHIKIANPLSFDFEYLRTSLAPGLLQSISENAGYFDEMKIFELGLVYHKQEADLANEKNHLAIAVMSKDDSQAFFNLKGAVEILLSRLNIGEKCLIKPSTDVNLWQKGKILKLETEDDIISHFGLVNREILTLFGIKKPLALAVIEFDELMNLSKVDPTFVPLPKFPNIKLDLSMEIDADVSYQEIIDLAEKIHPLVKEVSFLSEYRGEKITAGRKALAVRIIYRDNDKTLKLEEAQAVHNLLVKKLEEKYNIKVR